MFLFLVSPNVLREIEHRTLVSPHFFKVTIGAKYDASNLLYYSTISKIVLWYDFPLREKTWNHFPFLFFSFSLKEKTFCIFQSGNPTSSRCQLSELWSASSVSSTTLSRSGSSPTSPASSPRASSTRWTRSTRSPLKKQSGWKRRSWPVKSLQSHADLLKHRFVPWSRNWMSPKEPQIISGY